MSTTSTLSTTSTITPNVQTLWNELDYHPSPTQARFHASDLSFRGGVCRPYRWAWDKRPQPSRKGQLCRVLARGKMNSCLVQFLTDNALFITSRNGLRRIPEDPPVQAIDPKIWSPAILSAFKRVQANYPEIPDTSNRKG